MRAVRRVDRDAPVIVDESVSDAERNAAHMALANIEHEAAKEKVPDVEESLSFVNNFVWSGLILACAAGMLVSCLSIQRNARLLMVGMVFMLIGGVLLLYNLRVWHRRPLPAEVSHHENN